MRISDWSSDVCSSDLVSVRDDGAKRSLGEWLRFPELDKGGLLRAAPALAGADRTALDEAIQDHRYAPYVARQQAEIVKLRADDAVRIPDDFDYARVPGLSNEMVERLSASDRKSTRLNSSHQCAT